MRIRSFVLAVALTLSVAACGSGRAPAAPAGPLRILDAEEQFSDDIAWSIGVPVGAGGLAAVSMGALHNTGTAAIRITGVTLVGADGVTLAGAGLAPLAGSDSVYTLGGDTYDTFPPEDPGFGPLVDAAGFALPGTEPAGSGGYLLIVGYHTDARGHAGAVEVHYDAGGTSWTLSLPVSVTLCPAGSPADCPAGGS